MTIYQKNLSQIIQQHYGDLNIQQILELLCKIGVLDHTLCKILAVREFVADLQKKQIKKIDAMWIASEKFACTYEYIRKCMYYYMDINLPIGCSKK